MHCGVIGGEAEHVAQRAEELALCRTLNAIGIAHANSHFVGELSVLERLEGADRLLQGDAFQQDILINARQRRATRLTGEGLGDVADGVALALGLLSVHEGGVDHHVENGALG